MAFRPFVRVRLRGAASGVVLLTLPACSEGPPARLVAGKSDTVVVNSRKPVQLPVQVLDAAGRVLLASAVRYRWMSSDWVQVSEDGRATCEQPGDAEVRATLGELSTRLFVLCRPIRGFQPVAALSFVLGGPAQALPLAAVGVDGRPVTLLAASATIRNSEIASLEASPEGLRVSPRAPGATVVDVELVDCVQSIYVEVTEAATTSSALRPFQLFVVSPLRLVGGEIRSWRIPPGVYRLSLRPEASAPAELVLAAVATNCIRQSSERQDYFCLAQQGASVVVRHPRPIGRGRALAGKLSVLRVPSPWSDSGATVRNAGRTERRRKPRCPHERPQTAPRRAAARGVR